MVDGIYNGIIKGQEEKNTKQYKPGKYGDEKNGYIVHEDGTIDGWITGDLDGEICNMKTKNIEGEQTLYIDGCFEGSIRPDILEKMEDGNYKGPIIAELTMVSGTIETEEEYKVRQALDCLYNKM